MTKCVPVLTKSKVVTLAKTLSVVEIAGFGRNTPIRSLGTLPWRDSVHSFSMRGSGPWWRSTLRWNDAVGELGIMVMRGLGKRIL